MSILRLFCLTRVGSSIRLLDNKFPVDKNNWGDVDMLFTNRDGSFTKQEEISDKLAAFRDAGYQNDDFQNEEELTKLIDQIATPVPLAQPSGSTEVMQKRLLKGAVGSTICLMHKRNATVIKVTINT